MFYCDACATKNEWPTDFWIPRSRGPCEVCGKVAVCSDVASRNLPMPKHRAPDSGTAHNQRKTTQT